MNKVKLYCFPYAGGASNFYAPWKSHLAGNIELCAIELAGRGRRIKEPLYDSVKDCAADMYNIITNDLDTTPYALFGHSMGSAIALELAYKIVEENRKLPIHVFFSGRNAPHHSRDTDRMFHLMSEDKFREEVVELGGTPPDFFEHPELMEIFIPMLRSDFKMNETYKPPEGKQPLPCNVTVMYGKDDDMITCDMEEWRRYAGKSFKIIDIPGGHFYLQDRLSETVGQVNRIIADELNHL